MGTCGNTSFTPERIRVEKSVVTNKIGFLIHRFKWFRKKIDSSLDSPVTKAPAKGFLLTLSVASNNPPFIGPF
jgi:hypothetical protein